MLRYTVLKNGTGVLTTRTPRALGETLTFCIDGTAEGDRLVVTRADDKTVYRTLTAGRCTIPSGVLYGMLSVTLLQKGGAALPLESLFVEDVDGVRMLVPADMDLPSRVVSLEVACEELAVLRETLERQMQEIAKLRRAMSAVANWITTQEERGELPL